MRGCVVVVGREVRKVLVVFEGLEIEVEEDERVGGVVVVEGRAGVEEEEEEGGGRWEARALMTVSMVCSGNSGSHESIQRAVGVKPPCVVVGLRIDLGGWLPRLVVLLCREKDVAFAGILPRAFSDIPRS